MEKHVSTGKIVHNEVELAAGLEGEVQLHYEGVAQLRHHVALRLCMAHFLVLDNVILVDALHGKHVISSLTPNQHDFTKAAIPQHLERLEVISAHAACAGERLFNCFHDRCRVNLHLSYDDAATIIGIGRRGQRRRRRRSVLGNSSPLLRTLLLSSDNSSRLGWLRLRLFASWLPGRLLTTVYCCFKFALDLEKDEQRCNTMRCRRCSI